MLHEYSLPDGVFVIFSNTGLEHDSTYEFIHKIEEEWTDIIWLEYD
jgi:3'-phosphoadenosine 5'-phosphosulfate sulfotransferase (PAPS reductase)/FAD synthetase